ncbi:hypothetical protein KM803_13060 [Clostridium tyrobutyricum]|uniref:phage tail assembly chaperone G n=1 Tax=Clostridium tyrobutyricum TaxID=1519 RepID=UPI0010AA4454|nr:hypothetical protein [Clostridium tyrobutyricum]MBV4432247.1 hypothetical protein [Clostridium tyrobutyricum]QCH27989.1 hypothetical protein EZN00_01590 [Clostridium tyrobutyricum]
MEQITIKLNDKEYTMPRPKTRVVRDTLKFLNETKINFANFRPQDLDKMVGYVCDAFGKQFKSDDVYDGLYADDIMEKFNECMDTILSNLNLHLQQLPNENPPEETKE